MQMAGDASAWLGRAVRGNGSGDAARRGPSATPGRKQHLYNPAGHKKQYGLSCGNGPECPVCDYEDGGGPICRRFWICTACRPRWTTLPGFEESIACIGVEARLVGTVCTPCLTSSSTPATIGAVMNRSAMARESSRSPASEVRLAKEPSIFPSSCPLGEGRAVLIDYWGRGWPECGHEVAGSC